MSIDAIPLNPAWKSQAGASVSQAAPQEYAMESLLDYAVFSVSGTTVPGKYAGAEWYINRPIPSGAKACCLSFDMELSDSATQYAQALESDCIFTDPQGYKYNRSFQVAGLALEIARQDGSWVPFTTIPAKLATSASHRIQIFHTLDFVKRVSSTVAASLDGNLYLVPENLQNVGALKSNWTPNQVLVQMQETLTLAAGAFSESVGNMNLIWG